MDKLLFVAMSGAKQAFQSQAINTQNLANVNTSGFKEDFAAFRSLLLKGDGYQTRAYPILSGNGVNYSEGALVSTGRDLDMAIDGDGFIAVQGENRQEAFTREGSMRILPSGILVTARGKPVLGNNGGPVAIPPHDDIEIGSDGTISIVPTGQDPTALAVVDRIKLVKPGVDSLEKRSDGLFYQKNSEIQSPDASVKIMSGFLESSNVNSIDAMVKMIEQARLFEMDIKMMHTAQEMDTKSSELLRIS